MEHLSVSEVARRIGANPRDISDLFYNRDLHEDGVPQVCELLHEDPLPDHPDWSSPDIPTAELESVDGGIPALGGSTELLTS